MSPTRHSGPPQAPNRLLVIDDQRDVLDLIGEVAGTLHFQVALTDRPEDFEAQLLRFKPTVIVIDLQMPKVDGIELIRRLGRQQCKAQILIASGMDSRVLVSTEQLGRSLGLNMAGIMQKPLLLPDLEEALGRCMGQKAAINERALRHALEQSELRVYYQPKVQRRAGNWDITAVEALLRWEHPEQGLIFPGDFIPLAETSRLIGPMTEFVLREGTADTASWAQLGLNLTLTVNLSRKLVADADFPDRLSNLLRERGLESSRLVIEVTEIAALEDPARTLDLLTRLRVKNIGVSLDDFGIGFSSLTQLYQMPFTEIKIDRSLGMDVQSSREARTIVRSLVDLAHSLELKVCCEGVETAQALDFLQSVNCDYAQGYHIGRPMPAPQLAELARAWNGRVRSEAGAW